MELGDRKLCDVVLFFFIRYIILEIPGNILIKKTGAANWITAITIAWGAVTIGQGFVDSWISFSVIRAFLGAFEAVRISSSHSIS